MSPTKMKKDDSGIESKKNDFDKIKGETHNIGRDLLAGDATTDAPIPNQKISKIAKPTDYPEAKKESKAIADNSHNSFASLMSNDPSARIPSSISEHITDTGEPKILWPLHLFKLKIDRMPLKKSVRRIDLRKILEDIEQEVAKGENANLTKIESSLKSLAKKSPDLFMDTVSALTNPVYNNTFAKNEMKK